MRKSVFKKLSLGMALALVLGTTAHAGVAQAAEAWTLKKNSATVYLNEDNVKGTPNYYDFNFKNKPANWKEDYSFAWSIADEEVATVAKGGVVTGVSVGKTVVSCTVTNKETKAVEAVVTANVTVKANAADVEILDADKYVNGVITTGATVDFDRAMYDANGNKTTKRGVYVSDYTRWAATVAVEADGGYAQVAEDVVKINQSTGEFTFLKAGEYLVWCETYQSAKNNETIAQAVIKVVVADAVVEQTYTVGQNTVNGLLILFDNPVDAKAEGYVEKDFVEPIADSLNIAVKVDEDTNADVMFKSVDAYYGEDGKKDVLYGVKVTMWENFENKGVYTITFNEDEAFVLTASVGQPASVVIKVENKINKDITDVVYVTSANQEANKITLAFKDALGIDVTDSTVVGTTYVGFECDEEDENYFDITTEDGVAYLTVYPGANGKKGLVTVKYTEYDEEKGEEVTIFTQSFAVTAKDAPAVTITKAEVGIVAGSTIPAYHADKVTLGNKIAANDGSAKFVVWAKDNWNNEFTNAKEGFTYKLSNDKAAIEDDGTFVPYMTGSVKVSVYYADPAVEDAKAKFVTSFTVQILEDRVADSFTVEKKSTTTNLIANVVKKATQLTNETTTNIVEEAKWEVKVFDNFNAQYKADVVSFKDAESKKYFDLAYDEEKGIYTVTLKNNDADVMALLTNKDNAEKGSVTISAVLELTRANGSVVDKTISATLKKPASLKVSTYKLEVADINIGMLDNVTARTTVQLVGYNADGVKVAVVENLQYVPYGNQKNVKENLTAVGNGVFGSAATGSALVYTITTNNGKDIVNVYDDCYIDRKDYDKISVVSGQVINVYGIWNYDTDMREQKIDFNLAATSSVVSGGSIIIKAEATDYTVTVYEITKNEKGEFGYSQKATDTFKVTDKPATVSVTANKTKTEKSVDNTKDNALEWTDRADVKAAILDCLTIKVGDTDAKDYNMVFEVRSNGKTLYVKSVRIFAPALDKDGKHTSTNYVVVEASVGKVITLDAE